MSRAKPFSRGVHFLPPSGGPLDALVIHNFQLGWAYLFFLNINTLFRVSG